MSKPMADDSAPSSYARPMKPDGRVGNRRVGPSGKAGIIASALEHGLATGKYAFGQEISSSELAEQFDSSRHPVSIALNYLNSRGFVDVLPQVGYRVVSPAQTEIADMFLGLGKVEGLIASLAAERQLAGEGDLLLRIARQNRFTGLGPASEKEQFIACINDFHLQLRFMARSEIMGEVSASWHRLSSFYLWQGLPEVLPKAAATLNGERLEIAQAVAEGKADLAAGLMERHIVNKPYLTAILG